MKLLILLLLFSSCSISNQKYKYNIMECKVVNQDFGILRCESDDNICYSRSRTVGGISCQF